MPRPALALSVLFALAAGGAWAQDAADAGADAVAPANPLRCAISGYDVVLINDGAEPIVAGTVLNWSVPIARLEGTHALTSDLVPGGQVFMTAALGANYMRSGTPCDGTIAPAGG